MSTPTNSPSIAVIVLIAVINSIPVIMRISVIKERSDHA